MTWHGVDLDGTLAEFQDGQPAHLIGPPVPAMVERVKAWRAAGESVRILTARATPSPFVSVEALPAAVEAVEAWCLEHLGEVLPVTCSKDSEMLDLWDDRAVAVERNTGRRLS